MTHYLIEFYFGTCTYKYKITPNKHRIHVQCSKSANCKDCSNSRVHNKQGGQNKQGVGTKYKRKETKIGLSLLTLLTLLNIGISSILQSRLH